MERFYPVQEEFIRHLLTCDCRVSCWMGSIRSGKTHGVVGGLIFHSQLPEHKGGKYILVAQSHANFDRTLIPLFVKVSEYLNVP